MKKCLCCLATLILISSLAIAQRVSGPSVLCSPPPKVPFTNWAQVGFDPCLTWYNPYEFILNPSNVNKLAVSWSDAIGSNYLLQPVVANGIAYVTTATHGDGGNGVFAFDASTGAPLWTHYVQDATLTIPAVANGILYTGGVFDVYALNATTGATIWTAPAMYTATAPTVVDGVVYISLGTHGGQTDTTVALDARTGTTIWKQEFQPEVVLIDAPPAVANGVVYQTVGHTNNPTEYGVYALNATTGQVLWVQSVGAYGSQASPATVANNIVYVPAQDGTVYAFDAFSGALIWKQSLGAGGLAIAKGLLYVTTGAALYALNAADGTFQWTFVFNGFSGNSTIANGVLYLSESYPYMNLIALDAGTGALLWQHPSICGAYGTIVANGTLYTVTPGTPLAGKLFGPNAECVGSLLTFRLPN